MLATGHSFVETVTVLLLTVAFTAFASFLFRFFDVHLLAHYFEFLGIEFDIGAVLAFTLFAAEKFIGEAFTVEFETLGLFTIAF